MSAVESLAAARDLGRNVLGDALTLRLFYALLAFDVAFIGVVAAKALGLVSFHSGIGNAIIAGQLALVVLVLVSGWWHARNAALASLALVALLMAVEKIFKFHGLFKGHAAGPHAPPGLGAAAGGQVLGLTAYLLVFGSVIVAALAIGWRRSDRAGRASILLVGSGVAVMAATSIIADAIGSLLRTLLDMDRDTLSRAEQGLELFAASALLALAVGVVRVRWRG